MVNMEELGPIAAEVILMAQAGYDYTVVVKYEATVVNNDGKDKTITTMYRESLARVIYNLYKEFNTILGDQGTASDEFMTLSFPVTHGMIRIVSEETTQYVNLVEHTIEATGIESE
jgi:hypothetical protein